MILLPDYYNNKISAVTPEISVNSIDLLYKVNQLLMGFVLAGNSFKINPNTQCLISGSKDGDGGFRLSNSKTGSPLSSHKTGMGVDVYDPENKIDDWVTDLILKKYDLYREAPRYTNNWCHLSTRVPGSGHRTFIP